MPSTQPGYGSFHDAVTEIYFMYTRHMTIDDREMARGRMSVGERDVDECDKFASDLDLLTRGWDRLVVSS